MACADNTRNVYRDTYRKWVRPAMGHLTLARAAPAELGSTGESCAEGSPVYLTDAILPNWLSKGL